MATEFGPALEQNVNRWMTAKDKTFQGEKGEGLSRDAALNRLERHRRKSGRMADEMASIRENYQQH